MDVRKKLVELLESAFESFIDDPYCIPDERDFADHLIANGVTIQKWISVKDERKPKHGDIALCYMTFGEYRLLQWDDRSKLWVGDYMDYGFEDVAYWKLPEPPKGE